MRPGKAQIKKKIKKKCTCQWSPIIGFISSNFIPGTLGEAGMGSNTDTYD